MTSMAAAEAPETSIDPVTNAQTIARTRFCRMKYVLLLLKKCGVATLESRNPHSALHARQNQGKMIHGTTGGIVERTRPAVQVRILGQPRSVGSAQARRPASTARR